MDFTFSLANVYAEMSNSFYISYLDIEAQYQEVYAQWDSLGQPIEQSSQVFILLSKKEKLAIASVIFQALAIEAYTNLWGAVVYGKDVYEKQVEGYSTKRKIELISQACSSDYPEAHLELISSLFKKRNSLVHPKSKKYSIEVPSSYDYQHPTNNFSDMSRFYSEQFDVFEDLDVQMKLYQEFQKNVKAVRKSKLELIEEISCREVAAANAAVEHSIFEAIIKSYNEEERNPEA